MWASLGIGVSGSLIAAAICYWITERHLIPALVIGGAGIAGFILTWLFTKKPPPSIAPVPITQDNQQQFSPHTEIRPEFHISVGNNSPAAPAPAPEKKPEPRCNVQFVTVGVGQVEQQRVLSQYAGQTIKYAAAAFENKAITGEKLRIPRVRVRLIFRHPDGHIVANVPNAAWIRPPRESPSPYMRLEANTPQHVVIFWLVAGKLTCQSVVEDGYTSMGRHVTHRTHELNQNIGTVEVEILTENEKLYGVLLRFKDEDDNALPVFDGIVDEA